MGFPLDRKAANWPACSAESFLAKSLADGRLRNERSEGLRGCAHGIPIIPRAGDPSSLFW